MRSKLNQQGRIHDVKSRIIVSARLLAKCNEGTDGQTDGSLYRVADSRLESTITLPRVLTGAGTALFALPEIRLNLVICFNFEPKFVHNRDEKRDDVGDAFAGIA